MFVSDFARDGLLGGSVCCWSRTYRDLTQEHATYLTKGTSAVRTASTPLGRLMVLALVHRGTDTRMCAGGGGGGQEPDERGRNGRACKSRGLLDAPLAPTPSLVTTVWALCKLFIILFVTEIFRYFRLKVAFSSQYDHFIKPVHFIFK